MRRLISLFFVTILLVTFGVQIAFADGKCAEFITLPSGRCKFEKFVPRVSFGGGWVTTVRGGNLGANIPGDVQISWALNPASKDATYATIGTYSMSTYYIDSMGVSGVARGLGVWLGPEVASYQVDFIAPPQCNNGVCENKPTSDPNLVYDGTMLIGYIANGPDNLRGLTPIWVQVTHVSGLAASEFLIDPAPGWRGSFSATKDGRQGYAIAIGNPNTDMKSAPVIVEGKLFNNNNVLLGIQRWSVPSLEARAMIMSSPKTGTFPSGYGPGFGTDMFLGDSTTFTGRLELRVLSPAGGVITPVAFLFAGTGMSSAPMEALLQ
jgi:hypothetical protein